MILERIKKGVRYALLGWLSLYTASGAVAVVDYHLRHRDELGQNPPPPAQDIRTFLTDDSRLVTILGEVHMYNQSEIERVPRIVSSYDLITHEGGNPINDRIPFLIHIAADMDTLNTMAYVSATGREYGHGIISYAQSYRRTVPLETGDVSYEHTITIGRQITIIAMSFANIFIAPWSYYEGKMELSENRQGILDSDMWFLARYAVNIDERDAIIARNLARAIKESHAQRILCIVGRAHVDGVIRNLEEHIELTPTENPDFEENQNAFIQQMRQKPL